MNVSNHFIRRQSILDALEKCDSRDTRESLLLDKVIQLQDTLFELQQSYCELQLAFRRLSKLSTSPLDFPIDVYIPDYNQK